MYQSFFSLSCCLQESGGWGLPPPECTPSKGASFSDRAYDNPTFSIFNPETYEQTPELALTILLAAWPLSSFPFVFQLPIGSVLIIAGNTFFCAACHVYLALISGLNENPVIRLTVIDQLSVSLCTCTKTYSFMSAPMSACTRLCCGRCRLNADWCKCVYHTLIMPCFLKPRIMFALGL